MWRTDALYWRTRRANILPDGQGLVNTQECGMDKPLLRPWPEAAEVLSVSRTRIYEMIQRGELPGVVRLGRSVRVSSESLRAWVRSQASGESGNAPAA